MARTPEEIEALFAALENNMKNHDWYYDYCDDHGVWTQGKDQRNVINIQTRSCKEIDDTRTEALWDKLSPYRQEEAREAADKVLRQEQGVLPV